MTSSTTVVPRRSPHASMDVELSKEASALQESRNVKKPASSSQKEARVNPDGAKEREKKPASRPASTANNSRRRFPSNAPRSSLTLIVGSRQDISPDVQIRKAPESQDETKPETPHEQVRKAAESEDSDILANIQPLPAARQEEPSVAGAYAAGSAAPFSRGRRAVQGSSCQDQHDQDLEAPVVADRRPSTESLVEAELVDANDVVHAEKINETPRRRNVILMALALLIILALVITVIVLVISNEEDNISQDNILGASSPDTPLQEENCFQSHEQLNQAVTDYYQDPSPYSQVAQQYGWPMGTWCTFLLQEFRQTFHPQRSNQTLPQESQQRATYFSEDISNWDVSRVTLLNYAFQGAQNLSAAWGIQDWDVSKVHTFRGAFASTHWQEEPKLDLSQWDITNARTLSYLFQNANIQAAGIANWDTSNVKHMFRFADGAKNFNEDIGSWNTQSVRSLNYAFSHATSFNQDISRWNTSSVTTLGFAFIKARNFNQPLGGWDVSKNERLVATFRGASRFDQDLGQWNVSSVTEMRHVFDQALSFNQDLSQWDVSRVTNLVGAFRGAERFQQNLCAWGSKLPHNANTTNMFRGTNCPEKGDPVVPGGPFCFKCS